MEPVHTRGAAAAAALPALGAGAEDGEEVVGAGAVGVALALRAGGQVVEDGGIAEPGGVGAATDVSAVTKVVVGAYGAPLSALLSQMRKNRSLTSAVDGVAEDVIVKSSDGADSGGDEGGESE